jgi:hypothetical protein
MLKFLTVIGPARWVKLLLTRRGIRLAQSSASLTLFPTAQHGRHREFVSSPLNLNPDFITDLLQHIRLLCAEKRCISDRTVVHNIEQRIGRR